MKDITLSVRFWEGGAVFGKSAGNSKYSIEISKRGADRFFSDLEDDIDALISAGAENITTEVEYVNCPDEVSYYFYSLNPNSVSFALGILYVADMIDLSLEKALSIMEEYDKHGFNWNKLTFDSVIKAFSVYLK